MECEEIRQRLSAYLEGITSSKEKRSIEKHLLSCVACNVVLKDLKRTGELVRTLEEVVPQAWMKQKVLARIRREQETKRSILRKLFFPLRIKVPIQAAATVLIAVLAAYVFKAGEPEMKKVPSPVVTGEVTSKGKASKPPSAPAAVAPEAPSVTKEVRKPGERWDESHSVEEEQKGPMVPTAREKVMEAAPAPEAPAPGRREEARGRQAESGKSFGREGQGASSPGTYSATGGGKTEGYGAARDSMAKDRKAPAAALTFNASAAKKAETVNITVQVKDMKIAVGEIEELLLQLGATGVGKESLQDAEIITADLQSEKIEELMEKLKFKGGIKKKELPLKLPKGERRVRIEILNSR